MRNRILSSIITICLMCSFVQPILAFYEGADHYITLETNSVTLYIIDEEYEIPITDYYSGEDYGLFFTSSNSAVASVDDEGIITPKSEGIATISIETIGGATAYFYVTVEDANTYGVSFSDTYVTITIGETYQTSVEYTGTATEFYSSSNSDYVTVDTYGVITGENVGSSVITVTVINSYSGKTYTSTMAVIVEESAIKTLTILYDRDNDGVYEPEETVYVGDVYQLMLDSLLPLGWGEDDGTISYSSSDESRVTVDQNGIITAMAVGIATITGTNVSGDEVRVAIYVEETVVSDVEEEAILSADAVLTTEALVFDLKVPTSLPITVDSAGKVEVATDAQITNNSGGMVKVTDVSLDTTDSGWTIVGYDTDFTKEKVGLTQFGITLNSDEVATDGSLSLGDKWESLYADGGTLGIDYEVNVASQSSALSLSIATVEFTLDWDSVEVEEAIITIEIDYLNSPLMGEDSATWFTCFGLSLTLAGTLTHEGNEDADFSDIVWSIKDDGGLGVSCSGDVITLDSAVDRDFSGGFVITATYTYNSGVYTEDFYISVNGEII